MEGSPVLPIKAVSTDVTPPEVPAVVAAGQRWCFQDLAAEFAFFTPALLQNHGGLDRDVLQEFVRYYPSEPELWPKAIDAVSPFFSGMGVRDGVDYDRRLFYIHYSRWEALRDFIAGIAFYDQATQVFGRVRFTVRAVLDTAAVMQGRPFLRPPLFPVTIFLMATNRDFFTVAPPGGLLGVPLRVLREEPLPDIVVEAQRLFSAEFSEEEMHAVQKETGLIPPEAPT